MIKRISFCAALLATAACQAGFYTPTSTQLDADTGRTAWEGPNNTENLGSLAGTHSESSSYTYFSNWSLSNVNCGATSTASLSDGAISLSATNSSDGNGYDYTQAVASADVNFTLASSQFLVLNDSSTYADPGQVSSVLTGPAGWTWSGVSGSSFIAPAGAYDFSISADVQRTAGIDSTSSENATLQVVPEPVSAGIVCLSPFALRRKRRS